MKVQVGDVVKLQRSLGRGVVRFVGVVDFANGEWYGVELKQPRGKHNGTVNGKQYFTCEKGRGVFVQKNKIQQVLGQEQKSSSAKGGEATFTKGARVRYTSGSLAGEGTLDRQVGSEWRVVPETGDPLWIDEKNLRLAGDDDETRDRSHSNATPHETQIPETYPDVPDDPERRGRSNSTSSAKGPAGWRVGDLVQVYSNSKSKWFDDGRIDKIHAGRIFVVYNGTETKKWLPEKSKLVKSSERPGAESARRRSTSKDARRRSSVGSVGKRFRSSSLSRTPSRTASVTRINKVTPMSQQKRAQSHQPRVKRVPTLPSKTPPKDWSQTEVQAWLGRIGMERYSPAFEETNVTGAVLLDMGSEDLQKLGAHVIHTKKLMREIEQLKNGSAKADKRSQFNLKQWRQAIKSKVLMNAQTAGAQVRTIVKEWVEQRETEDMEELAVKKENISNHQELTAGVKAENEEARILYIKEVYTTRVEERSGNVQQREAEDLAELVMNKQNIEQFKQMVATTKDAISQARQDRCEMVYKARVDQRAETKETIEREAIADIVAVREYIVAFKSGVVKIKAENQAEAESMAKEWYKRRVTERNQNIQQIEEESAEELADKQAYIDDHTQQTADIKAENEAEKQQNISMWQERRATERKQNVAQIEAESAEELAEKQENIVVFKDQVVGIKSMNAGQQQANQAEWYRRRVTERQANMGQRDAENAGELADKQQYIGVFKDDVVNTKAQNAAMQDQNIQMWQERRKTERAANIAQIEQESAAELADKQGNIMVFKEDVIQIKASNAAEAQRMAEEWYRRRVTERDQNIAQRDGDAAEEIAYKQSYINEHQDNTQQIKAENEAVRVQNVQMWQERRKTERASNIATIEAESAEELASKQGNIAVFKDTVVEIKSANAAQAEANRVEWYRRRVTERESNIQQRDTENAMELGQKQENIVVFKDDVNAVKNQNEAQRQANVQMWQERRRTERIANVNQIEAESAEELAGKQEFIVVFKDGVAEIKSANTDQAEAQRQIWYQTRVEERTSNINQMEAESAAELSMKQENVMVFKDNVMEIKAQNSAVAEQNRQGFWQARMTERAANIQSIETESAEELAQKQEYVGVHKDTVADIKSMNAAQAEAQRAEFYARRVTERNANTDQRNTEAAQEIAEKQENIVVFKDGVTETKATNQAQKDQNVASWQQARASERAANVQQIEAESAEELAMKQEYIGVHKDATADVKAANAAQAQANVQEWQQRRATERAGNIAQIEQESAEELAGKQSDIQGHKANTAQIKSENTANQQLQQQYWQERRRTERQQNVAQIEQESEEELMGKQENVDLHRSAIVQSKDEITNARDNWLKEVKDMHGAYKDELAYKREMGIIEDAERIEEARWTSLPDSYLNAFNQMDLDGDGQIDFVEFQAAINSLGLDWDEQRTWTVFRKMDTDNSGALDLDEFEAVITKVEHILQANPDANSNDILRLTFNAVS